MTVNFPSHDEEIAHHIRSTQAGVKKPHKGENIFRGVAAVVILALGYNWLYRGGDGGDGAGLEVGGSTGWHLSWSPATESRQHICYLHQLLRETGHENETILEYLGQDEDTQQCIMQGIKEQQHGKDQAKDQHRKCYPEWHSPAPHKNRPAALPLPNDKKRSKDKGRHKGQGKGKDGKDGKGKNRDENEDEDGRENKEDAMWMLAEGLHYVLNDGAEFGFYVEVFMPVLKGKGVREGVEELCAEGEAE